MVSNFYKIRLSVEEIDTLRVLKLNYHSKQRQEIESMCRVFEYLSDAVAVTEGSEHRLKFVNDAFGRLSPLQREQILGCRFAEILPQEGKAISRFLEQAYKSGEVHTLEELETAGPSGPQWWRLTVIPHGTEDRQLILILHEITQRVRARLDEAVYKSRILAEERAYLLESLIQSISDPVVLVNPLAQVVGLNREAADYLGVESGVFLDCNLDYASTAERIFLNGGLINRHELPISRALKGEVVRGVEMIIKPRNRPENNRVFSLSASPVRDLQGNIILAVSIARDISDRVSFERAKDGFASVASHEMRTPLGIVRGLAQLMEINFKKKAEMAPYLRQTLEDHMEKNGLSREIGVFIDEFLDQEKALQHCTSIIKRVDQMARLISEVLDASRLETGQVEINNQSFNLLPVVQEVCQRLQFTTERHSLEVQAEGENYLVFGDRDRLDQVVTNLVSNAIKYSPSGGPIVVHLKHKIDEIEVGVRDQGVGIPEKEQKYIFERFYRVQKTQPEASGGLGLGLYISRQIVLEHGGNIWLESVPGEGSTFYFSLPSDEAF